MQGREPPQAPGRLHPHSLLQPKLREEQQHAQNRAPPTPSDTRVAGSRQGVRDEGKGPTPVPKEGGSICGFTSQWVASEDPPAKDFKGGLTFPGHIHYYLSPSPEPSAKQAGLCGPFGLQLEPCWRLHWLLLPCLIRLSNPRALGWDLVPSRVIHNRNKTKPRVEIRGDKGSSSHHLTSTKLSWF